jgi:hypothetical protein
MTHTPLEGIPMEEEVNALMGEEDEAIWRQAGLFSTTDLAGFNGDFKALREAVKAQLSVPLADVGQTHSGFALSENLQRSGHLHSWE